ncbi:Fis family transcriptional regulator [Pelagibaculum spongiae]|uniref:Fis family transcriptional regulator n=1 Tax=Pelagibaculum spongiae TaxID=2080658 RepID=A0A2V1GV26_9GAMM|nr:Fis family transcriptional regulator [Pelagibaculum spongiae]PVZ69541.1 Fis family transcriptional regulator [Pelagibaculum spongiae]
MNKVTAKFDSRVCKALATATEKANAISGFSHFSHQADWSNFPNSLMVSCHFQDAAQSVDSLLLEEKMAKLLQANLLKQGIKFKDIRKNIKLVTQP